MARLSAKLNEIGKDLKSLINTSEVFDKDDKLLDNQDLCFMLHITELTFEKGYNTSTYAIFCEFVAT